MNRAATLGLLLVAALGLGMRLPELARRPLHTDESVHAVKFLGLWERGEYRYDPNEYHGPSLYYATLPFAWLSGAKDAAQLSEPTLRLVPVCFGVGLILLLPLLRDVLGQTGVVAAGLLTAISPAFVFYSRYYIHEIPLVCFTLLLLGSAWRYWQSGQVGWAIAAGAALGLMHATKETFVFVLAALVLAAAATILWERVVRSGGASAGDRDRHPRDPARPTTVEDGHPVGGSAPGRSGMADSAGRSGGLLADWQRKARGRLCGWHLVLALAAMGSVSALLFTSGFTHAGGLVDSVRTYLPWLSRAGGNSPHIHPWYFYFQRLGWFHAARGPVWSELLILLLALAGWVAALSGRKPAGGCLRFLRFLGFYTAALTAIYCAIAYKTPWCLLGFHHGMVLLAGAGAVVLWDWSRTHRGLRAAVAATLLFAAAQLGLQSWRAAFPYATDRRNPYVYAHTSKDLFRLIDKVRAIAMVSSNPEQLLIKAMAPGGDYWPLPWYLRQFKQVGWFDRVPPDPYAPLMIVSARYNAEFDEQSAKRWLMVSVFEHRPGVVLELYVAFDLWKRYIESLPKNRDDD